MGVSKQVKLKINVPGELSHKLVSLSTCQNENLTWKIKENYNFTFIYFIGWHIEDNMYLHRRQQGHCHFCKLLS